ncbi:MAG: class I SAM-dependent methyltransferase [Pseudomonadota bacterium]
MLDLLTDFAARPPCFSVLTSKVLWTDKHLAEQMLRFHLDPEQPLASRTVGEIDAAVDWLNSRFALAGKRVMDLGCGPGLYAERLHACGARVTGVDWSASSVEYAQQRAREGGWQIDYVQADYTVDPLPVEMDLCLLIYCDFCALSPPQRQALLAQIRRSLAPGGQLVLDVFGMGTFAQHTESAQIEHRLMNGFWSADDYVGLLKSFKYADEAVTLERYLIIEQSRHWQVYNWLQHYSPDSLTREFAAAGFKVEQLLAGFTDEPAALDSPLITAIAQI